MVYKILSRSEWNAAKEAGSYQGSEVDIADGFIHFSSANQVIETATKHFHGQHDLLLLGVDETCFGDRLKWEASRGGQLFPHLYDSLDCGQVSFVSEFPVGPDGVHVLPVEVAEAE